MEEKKEKIIVGMIIVAIIIVICLFLLLYKKLIINKNVTIRSDEEYIATIYYDYEMGIDASRGYDVLIYRDSNGYKYEIKYGEITIAGPTETKTIGYGILHSQKDIENLNNSFEKKKGKYETFSIKYRIINEQNSFEYCDLNELNDLLFK